MRFYLSIYLLFFTYITIAQDSTAVDVDDKYREDQFYASITYNNIMDNPKGISSSDFSTGFHFGFIRDMPVNEKRNLAFAIGLGVSTNLYNQNLIIRESASGTTFTSSDASFGNIAKNKFTTYVVDMPFEFRWRTSNAKSYKFWRIYPGFKLSYVLFNSSKLESELEDVKLTNIDEFNKLQYGLTLSAGYGTWNFQVYYGLNSIFNNSANLNGESIDSKALRIGIMFYIL